MLIKGEFNKTRQAMKICILVVSALLCFRVTTAAADRGKMTDCKSGRCKIKLNRRLRILRDLSKTLYPDSKIIDITLKTLHNREDGDFGIFDKEGSIGYDIPQIACPLSEDKTEMLACPTPDRWKRIHCIDYFSLCDRKINCPNGEDEDPTMCLFHSATDMYMKKMMSSMYQLYRQTQEALANTKTNYLDFK